MKISERIKRFKNNTLRKTLFFAVLSIVITFAFVVYNLYLSIRFKDAFAIGICIYYAMLVLIRSATLIMESRIMGKADEVKAKIRTKNYIISSALIFIIDACLIAPIIIMALFPKEVGFGIIPAIVMATYSFYKIISTIVGYIKSKKTKNLTIILLKEINMIEAIVSILTLQHTLIMVNGGMDNSMQTLSLITSVLFIAVIIVFSALSYYKNRKLNQ